MNGLTAPVDLQVRLRTGAIALAVLLLCVCVLVFGLVGVIVWAYMMIASFRQRNAE